MFKNSNNEIDIEAGHTCSGRSFREVPLSYLFKHNYKEDGLYSGEEADLRYEEYSESARAGEVETEELFRGEKKASGTVPTIEISIVTPRVVLETLSRQSNQSNQSTQSIVTRILVHTQSRNEGKFMEDEMRLPIFRGYGSEYPDQPWFLCEAVWIIKKSIDEAVKRAQFSTTFRDCALRWYMKFVSGSV
jgi:hypothetical protein